MTQLIFNKKLEKTTILEVENVSQVFAKNKDEFQLVLKEIHFSINNNEIVSLLGKSGAGKSTFLRIVAGLLKPSSGEVRFKGKLVNKPNENMAMVFQTFALLPWLTVLDNVAFGLEARNLPKKIVKEKAMDMLNLIGLGGYEDSFPKELSGGMRQRVGFARALAIEPELLLLDGKRSEFPLES